MFFWFVRNCFAIAARLIYRVRISGAEHIPSEGAYIICANHFHTFDPGIIAASINRRIYFIAKKELWDNRFKRPFLKPLGVFPVNRGVPDMRAYKHALEVLNQGNGLLVFCQGRRMKEFAEFKRGAAMFALKTGACIIPVGIQGTYKPFSVIRVRIDPPLSMERYKGSKIKSDLVDKVMDEVAGRVKRLSQ